MKRFKILGIIRHVLTFVGGALVLSGKVDVASTEVISGGLLTVIGGLWSVLSPEKR